MRRVAQQSASTEARSVVAEEIVNGSVACVGDVIEFVFDDVGRGPGSVEQDQPLTCSDRDGFEEGRASG